MIDYLLLKGFFWLTVVKSRPLCQSQGGTITAIYATLAIR